MPRDATLHVKLDSEMDEKLKRLAATRGMSKGELVRSAIAACYQTALDDLPIRQQQAVSAYQGGYIGIGKLAKELGMHVLQLRGWLEERGLRQRTGFNDSDVQHA